jgi:hypothetical protein
MGIEIVYVAGVIATELRADVLIEIRQVFAVHMLGIVLQHGGQHLLVERGVPFAAVVGKLHVLLLGLLLRSLHFHAVVQFEETHAELVGSVERFHPVGERLVVFEAATVERCQLLEVEFALQVARGVLVSLYALFVETFLIDDADGIDAFVHAHGILPVVGTLGELRVVLDAHGLAGAHVAEHGLLLDAAHLDARLVLGVAHLAGCRSWRDSGSWPG